MKRCKVQFLWLLPLILVTTSLFIGPIFAISFSTQSPFLANAPFFLRSLMLPDVNIVPDPYLYNQWGYFAVGADYAYVNGIMGKNKSDSSDPVVVAILDTGVDTDHPDLVENLIGYRNFLDPPYNDPSYIEDRDGHGTHCAGIICAKDNLIGVRGVAPRAKFWAMKVMNDISETVPTGDPADIAEAINWIVSNMPPSNKPNGVDIISMSLGSDINDVNIENAIQAAVSAGIIVVAAAGNDLTERSPMLYPARLPNVIAVGAVTYTNRLAAYSMYTSPSDKIGPGDQIDLVAPGGGYYDEEPFKILSTFPESKGGYGYAFGTSMATPLVAGIIALYLGEGVPPSAIPQTLSTYARDLGSTGYDYETGYGLVQATNIPPNYTDFIIYLIIYFSIIAGGTAFVVYRVRNNKEHAKKGNVALMIFGIHIALAGLFTIFIGLPGNSYKYYIPYLGMMTQYTPLFVIRMGSPVNNLPLYNLFGIINFSFIFGVCFAILGAIFYSIGTFAKFRESASLPSWKKYEKKYRPQYNW